MLETGERENGRLKQEVNKISAERENEKLLLSSAIGSCEEKIRQLEENLSSLNRQTSSLRSVNDSVQRKYDDLLEEHNTFKVRDFCLCV